MKKLISICLTVLAVAGCDQPIGTTGNYHNICIEGVVYLTSGARLANNAVLSPKFTPDSKVVTCTVKP